MPLATWSRHHQVHEHSPAARKDARDTEDSKGPEERARQLIRRGLLPHIATLITKKLVKALLWQREELLEAQEAGTQRMRELERRLAGLQIQAQARFSTYESQITKLENELARKDRLHQKYLKEHDQNSSGEKQAS